MIDFTSILQNVQTAACIGSTKLTTEEVKLCNIIGYFLASKGIKVATGNAIQADQGYAAGANSVDESLVHLYIVDDNHNRHAIQPGNIIHYHNESPEWQTIAAEFHPRYSDLSPYVQKLMNRNAGIILGADLVIAWPNINKSWGGGTAHGMKIAKAFNKPLWNLLDTNLRNQLTSYIRSYLIGERASHERKSC